MQRPLLNDAAISFLYGCSFFNSNKYMKQNIEEEKMAESEGWKKMSNVANHMKRKAVILLLFVLDLCSPLSLLYSIFFLLFIAFDFFLVFPIPFFVIWLEINRACQHTAAHKQKKYTYITVYVCTLVRHYIHIFEMKKKKRTHKQTWDKRWRWEANNIKKLCAISPNTTMSKGWREREKEKNWSSFSYYCSFCSLSLFIASCWLFTMCMEFQKT